MAHAEGKLNLTAIGTRGMTVQALKKIEWLTGRTSLSDTEETWPRVSEKLQISIQEEPEPVMEAVVMEPAYQWERFRSLKKMSRVLLYCLRWKQMKLKEFWPLKNSMRQSWHFWNVFRGKFLLMVTIRSLKGSRCWLQLNNWATYCRFWMIIEWYD